MASTISFIPAYMLQDICAFYKTNADREGPDEKEVAGAGIAPPGVGKLSWKQKYDLQSASLQSLFQSIPQGINPPMPLKPRGEAKEDIPGRRGLENFLATVRVYDMHYVYKEPDEILRDKAQGFEKKIFTDLDLINDLFARRIRANIFSDAYPKNTMRTILNTPGNSAYNNAYWLDDTSSVYFGDVDPDIFKPFHQFLDITAHEFGHGFTRYSSHLEYQGQSGALNESISDVVGICAKHLHTNKKADEADWLVGNGILVPHTGSGTALRSMKEPGAAFKNHPVLKNDEQPNHMDRYVDTKSDNGGVHYNSGIPNKAFYLVSTAMQGYSFDTPMLIWHAAASVIKSNANFKDFGLVTVVKAKELRLNEGIRSLVNKAWFDVGVKLTEPEIKDDKPRRCLDRLLQRVPSKVVTKYRNVTEVINNHKKQILIGAGVLTFALLVGPYVYRPLVKSSHL